MNSKNFEQSLTEACNSTTLFEVEKYGYRHFEESYINAVGLPVKTTIYELNSQIYR